MHYSDVIIYPDCKGTGMRSLDKPTELFAVITICRHSLHQGVMAFMHLSNLDLNSLMFSYYKNTITGKALIGIALHGMGLFFSDICLPLLHVLVEATGQPLAYQNMN